VQAISLFSGVGGFEIGFERAGIETVLQAERDPWCLEVLERHWPETERVTDVRLVLRDALRAERSRSAIGDRERAQGGSGADRQGRRVADGIDLVYGGFPCQDLSVAGKRAGLGGERSGLWFEFERVLRELRPRWAVIENVPGLLSSNGGRDFGVILCGLDELGFDVAWTILDAQHFGVPQRRRRVFVVAGPRGRGAEQVLSLCESCGGNPETGGAPGEELAGTLGAGSTDSQRGWRGDLDSSGAYIADVAYALTARAAMDRPESGAATLIASAISASAGHHGHSSPRGDGSDNLIAGTLQAEMYHHGGYPNQTMNSDNAHVLPVEAGVRRLTPRECERLMGWPDDWTRWTADGREIADSHRYRMAGNGVVATCAEWIGHRLVVVDGMAN
jgi:DNA (cytosine-5)-methyltransferase 1